MERCGNSRCLTDKIDQSLTITDRIDQCMMITDNVLFSLHVDLQAFNLRKMLNLKSNQLLISDRSFFLRLMSFIPFPQRIYF